MATETKPVPGAPDSTNGLEQQGLHPSGEVHWNLVAPELNEQLVRDVARAQVRKYQHVGWFLQGAERIAVGQDPFVERAIGLHFSIHDQIRIALPHQLNGARDLLRIRMTHRAEI